MANNLGALTVSLGLDAASYMRGLNKAEFDSQRTAQKIEGQFKRVATAIASIGVGAIFVNSIKSAADFADEMGKTAQRAGSTAEEFSKLAFAARQADVSSDQLARGLRLLGQDAGKGGEALAAAGISIRNSEGAIKTNAELFKELGSAIAGIEDPQRKAALATKVLGDRLGPELIPLLNLGADGLKDLADEAEKFGRVVTDEAVRAAEEFNDNLTKLKEAASGITNQLAGPLIQSLANSSTAFLQIAKDVGFAKAALISFGGAIARTIGADEIGKLQREAKSTANAIALTVKQIETFQRFADSGVSGAAERVRQLNEQYARLQANAGKTSDALKEAADEATASTVSTSPIVQTFETQVITGSATKDKEIERLARERARALQRARDEELRAEKKLQEEILEMKRTASIQGGLTVEAENEAIQRARDQYDRWIETVKASTFEGKAAAQTAEINKLFEAVEAGRLSWDEYEQASSKALGLTGEALEDVNKELKNNKSFADDLGFSFSSAFEDAIIGGKNFGDVLKGLEQDIIRLIVRQAIIAPLGNALGASFQGIFSGGKAIGGDVMGGRSYMVGERGPELFTPMGNGSITPNSGGPAIYQTISIDARGADAGVEQRIMQAMRQTKAETLAEVQAKANRGGSFARAVGRG